MPTQLERPMGVPAAARWIDDEGHWQLVESNATGQAHGPVKLWRADGTLLLESHYEAGALHGPFRRYHRSGALAREGHYVAGDLDGVVMAHAAGEGSDEPLRGCCVPQGAARMQARFELGVLAGETFYDAEGFALLSNGQRRPERPVLVPPNAHFEESSARWYDGPFDRATGMSFGLWTWWRQDGTVSEEADYQVGQRVATRHFDTEGQLKESIALLVHEGFEIVAHGPWRRRLTSDEAAAWGAQAQDGDVVWLQGLYDRGQSVGAWKLQIGVHVVWQRQLGEAFTESEIDLTKVESFGDSAALPHWIARAEALHAQGRVREALVAMARAVATGAPAARFVDAHRLWALPKPTEIGQQEARRLAKKEERKLHEILDGLICGANFAECLRLLSTALPAWSDVARDLVEASLAIEPSHKQSVLSRAFVRLERAEDKGLAADVQNLAEISEESAEFFRFALQVFRPSWAFLPNVTPLPALSEPLELIPAQPLQNVQHVARVYASRLLLMRTALAAFGAADKPWAPPDLSAWLPEGPVGLCCEDAQIEDEDEEGRVELTTVHIDETLSLANFGVGAMIQRARADWAGLCWLLWAVGQSAPAWPDQLTPRPEYAQALQLSVERAWRARDQVVTSGIRSMNQGVGEFVWEGLSLTELPHSLLQVCLDELLEMRAVLLWLSNAGNLSPFQSDLRQVR